MYVGSLPAASNRATYIQSFQVNDSETDDLVDLSAAAITYSIRDKRSKTVTLSATVGDGVTVTATGVFEVEFTDTEMRTLCDQEYEVGCTIEIDDEVSQYIIGTLPILDGIVA